MPVTSSGNTASEAYSMQTPSGIIPRLRRVLQRWLVALLAVACGWVVGYLPFLYLAYGAGWHGLKSFALVTGAFSVAGWFLVGLPLAIAGPRIHSPGRVVAAALASGCAGIIMVAAVFQGFGVLVCILAFLPAAASMLFYAAFEHLRAR